MKQNPAAAGFFFFGWVGLPAEDVAGVADADGAMPLRLKVGELSRGSHHVRHRSLAGAWPSLGYAHVDSTALRLAALLVLLVVAVMPATAADATLSRDGLTLLGVALLHRYTLQVALAGLAVITAYKLMFTGFKYGDGLAGLASHMAHEWVMLANLFCLLMGFALLSRHFEESHVPGVLPRFLPDDWKGAIVMLVMVFVLSSLLDNIAAALTGGAMAHSLFKAKVHIGYLAAIVTASNAGGSGSWWATPPPP
jgi:hypothetical protein